VDARIAALAGADAIGLNFYEYSARCIPVAIAEQIAAEVRNRAVKVGVFVNASAEKIVETTDRVKLDWVQLHGDEPPEMLLALGTRQVIKAFRIKEGDLNAAVSYLDECRRLGRLPDAVLLDSYQEGEYGGTGAVADWKAIGDAKSALGDLPLILAGGLTPFNVEEAIRTVSPVAVDTASGVESKPGQKDPMLLRAFVSAARKGFAGVA
jgi:phosphoribosylanthranilate isomerase